MRLFIAEKPDLAKIIAEALGGGTRRGGYIECGNDVVTWCIGHLLELAPPEVHNPAYKAWVASDLPMKLRPALYQPIAKTQEQLVVVGQLLERASEVVHAGDPDDEGQLLVDEVLTFYGNTAPVGRLLINDLNVGAATKALAKIQPNEAFFGLSEKARARSIGDQLYGFNMTRAYTLAAQARGHRGMLAVGRVQTVILGMIVSRYQAHKGHAGSAYYTLSATLEYGAQAIKVKYLAPDAAPKDDKRRITDEGFISNVADACQGQAAVVVRRSVEEKQAQPPLPYALLDLQAEMSKDHGLSAEKTLAITQALREKHRAITYNRSDCSYLSTEQFQAAPDTLQALAHNCPDLVTDAVNVHQKSRAFNDDKVTAHTAIIPTAARVDLEQFTKSEQMVYLAIVKRYLAQFLPNKQYLSVQVGFTVAGHEFVASAIKVTVPGWTALIGDPDKADSDSDDAADTDDNDDGPVGAYEVLSSLQEQAEGRCAAVAWEKKKTKPPALYTESALLKDLRQVAKYVTDPKIKKLLLDRDQGKQQEHGGIGTPATRGAMLEKLQERGYYVVDNKKLVPTKIGLEFHAALPAIATKPDMTALWHEQQVLIERGELTVDQFLDELEAFIANQIGGIDLASLQLGVQAPCPMCGSRLAATAKTLTCTAEACEFVCWGEVAGRVLSDDEIHQLLTKGRTGLLKGFRSNGGNKFDAGLKITAAGKIEMVFPATKPQKKRA